MKLRISLGIILLVLVNMISSNNVVIAISDETNVVFLGASNTVEEITSVPRNGSYITYLRTLNPTWQGVNLIEKATPGWGVRNYYGEVSLLNKTVFAQAPDYVIVVLGGNDFLRSLPPDQYEVKLHWLLDALIFLDAEKSIKQIFIANIFWGTLEIDEIRTSVFEQFQEIITNTSLTYEFPLLDFFDVTENHPEYYVDSIHLNDLGHQAIATEVNNIIEPYLLGNLTRTADYPEIIEIYTNSYIEKSPNFVFGSSVLFLAGIAITIKLKKKIS